MLSLFWLRSRVRTVTLSEAMQLIALLAFSMALPVLIFPAFFCVTVYLLHRAGLTAFGMCVIFAALAALLILGICLAAGRY
jgi:hypothetical protein